AILGRLSGSLSLQSFSFSNRVMNLMTSAESLLCALIPLTPVRVIRAYGGDDNVAIKSISCRWPSNSSPENQFGGLGGNSRWQQPSGALCYLPMFFPNALFGKTRSPQCKLSN